MLVLFLLLLFYSPKAIPVGRPKFLGISFIIIELG